MDTLEWCKTLVAMDSSTKEGANKAVRRCAEEVEAAGIQGRFVDDEGYLSYVAALGQGPRTLIFNGHLDVVSAKAHQFEPYISEGRLYGRGTADMKTGVAAMMGAFLTLAKDPPDCRVLLQLVPDEEIGGFHGTQALVKAGYLGDFAICPEPTNLTVGIQSKGIIRLQIRSKGKPAHGSRPWEGDNAILKGLENFKRIVNLPIMKEGSSFYEGSSANLARISGGDIYNRVPDESIINLDIRYVPHIHPEDLLSHIIQVVEGEVELKHIGPGVHNDPEDGDIKALAEAMTGVTGKKARLCGQHGSADTRFFAEKGIAAVEFGPRGGDWHGDAEYVEIQSMLELEQILLNYAREFSKR